MPRNIILQNTETVLLLLCLVFIMAAKMANPHKFRYFLGLFFLGKYLKVYGKEQGLHYSWFHVFLFVVQLISFGMFAAVVAAYFNLNIVLNVLVIIMSLAVFILSKFLIEKIISILFLIEKFADHYNFHKLSYRNFMGMALLPFNALLIYSPMNKDIMMYTTLTLFISLNIAAIVLTLKSNQKAILKQPLYFILYLCTLEIAPYLIVVKSFGIA